MKKFLYFITTSCLGMIIGSVLLISMLWGIIAIFGAAMGENKATVHKNSILMVDFTSAVPEKTNNVSTSPISFNFEDKTLGLYDVTRSIEMAKEDEKIKGIYMKMSGISMGAATASRVRRALESFKESGKFVYAYGDSYSQGAYYLASVADSIYAHPLGNGVEFKGYASTTPFFKNMLDKIGVKMQIFYVGNFKSATEPFRRENMSEESKLQTREYMEGLFKILLKDISVSRDIPVSELRTIADEYLVRSPKTAKEYGFVDKLIYKDEMIAILMDKLGVKTEKKMKIIDLSKYATHLKSGSGKDRIAVVFAEGNIVDGEGENGNIGGKKYAKEIRKIRQDKKVKAIVLRVNSGGGSAFASEEIWRELELAKKQGLPVVASMGDVAASGGYYISSNADTILAEPNTITGSIGVFGMIPNATALAEEKLGVHFDTVKTGAMAAGISPFLKIGEKEGEIIQNSVEEVYEIFLKRVKEGRNYPTRAAVHEVAQGRVWTGEKAKELGLVDVMGGLDDAIKIAANMSNLEKYRIRQYPKTKEPLEAFLEGLTGQSSPLANAKKEMIRSELGEEGYEMYQMVKEVREMQGVQARMPYSIVK